MKKLDQNPLDQFFRESLESPDLKFKEQDWQGLEKLLLEKSNKRYLLAWRTLAGIAAGLLIFVSIWLFKPAPVSEGPNYHANAGKSQKKEPDKESNSAASTGKTKELRGTETAKKINKDFNNSNEPDVTVKKITKSFNNSTEPDVTASLKVSGTGENRLDFTEYASTLKATNKGQINPDDVKITATPQFYKPLGLFENKTKTTKTENTFRRTSFAFSVSPDLNSAESFNKSSLGASFGIGTSYRVNKILNVNTGVYYSKKTYSASPANYKSSAEPFNYARYARLIDADCRVLDIPLNLNFTLLNKSGKSLFATAGVSSYFMLKEKYTFIRKTSTGYPATGPDPSYTIDNKNNHIFSVLNIGAGLSKPIGKNSDMVIQPYAKLPLTGIGQGKVNLQSVGVAFQLNYKFLKRPAHSKSIKQSDFK